MTYDRGTNESVIANIFLPQLDKTSKMDFVPSESSFQLGHPSDLPCQNVSYPHEDTLDPMLYFGVHTKDFQTVDAPG